MNFLKRKKKEKDFYEDNARLAYQAFIFAGLIFASIYLLDYCDMASKIGLVNKANSKDWLAYTVTFLSNYAGAFIGFVGAIMAINLSTEKQAEFREEDNRLNALPMIKIESSGEEIVTFPDGEEELSIYISISNAGNRELYNLWINGFAESNKKSNKFEAVAPILYGKNGDTITITPRFLSGPTNCTASAFFKDCYDNWYSQEISAEYHEIYDQFYYKIASAPIMVNKKDLPEEIRKTIHK